MRLCMLSTIVIGSALVAGCAATVSGDAYGPDLVYVGPGVQVIADYDEPIFYADNVYWRFDGVTWYRSRRYTGGWVYAPPPPAIRRIERPHEYVHYRPAGWVARREPSRAGPVRGPREDRRADEPRRVEPSPSPPPPAPRAIAPPPPQAPPPRAVPSPRPAPPPRSVPPPQRHAPTGNDPRDQHEHHE